MNVPATTGARAGAPEHCGRPTAWIPQVGRMDATGGPTFEAFDAYDGQNNPVRIDSLHKLRQVEEESLKMAADGEGQPVIWRRWSQDRSNHDVNTLAPRNWNGGEAPSREAVKKFAPDIRRQMSEADAPDYGPGVSDATPSALDTLDWKG